MYFNFLFRKIKAATESLQKHVAMGKAVEDAWNASTILISNAGDVSY